MVRIIHKKASELEVGDICLGPRPWIDEGEVEFIEVDKDKVHITWSQSHHPTNHPIDWELEVLDVDDYPAPS